MVQAKYGRFTTSMVIAVAFVVAASLWTFGGAITPAQAQGPPAQQQMQQRGAPPAGAAGARGAGARGRGSRNRGPRRPAPMVENNYEGFEKIFDGTLTNWDGDPSFWRVEDDMIVGESTPENPVKRNTFMIWRGGEPADFELKIEYRMNSTNSGVQYRSEVNTERGQWSLRGYQADIDFTNVYSGMLYEEGTGRGILCMRGQICQIESGKQPQVIGNLESGEHLKGYLNINGWNQYHIIARGNHMTHMLNGHVTVVVIDDDVENRKMSGLIGLQMHAGDPMKVEFRNIYLKNL